MFFKIGVLKNFAKSPKGLQLYEKETPTLGFFCEYGKYVHKSYTYYLKSTSSSKKTVFSQDSNTHATTDLFTKNITGLHHAQRFIFVTNFLKIKSF